MIPYSSCKIWKMLTNTVIISCGKKNKEEVKYASDVNWMALTSVTRIWEKEIKRTHCNVETELEAREHSKHDYQCFASKLG